MENEHSELIIGYLQGRLQGRSLDDFYAWVNESADNKKLFFETKALYEACAPSRGASEIHDSWLRLLDKRKSRQRKRYSLLTRISTYAAVAMFAAAITSTVFIFSSRDFFRHKVNINDLTNFHVSYSCIKSSDHLACTADEFQRFATVVRGIKLCSVIESSSVMCAAGFADVASCDFRHFKILQMILICGNGQFSSNGQFPVISDAYLSVY